MLSSIAACFSIMGLTAIFAASAITVGIMAGALETAKVVTAMWLHLYWEKIALPLKVYLFTSVVVLMGITSIGVYGYLAKAHIASMIKLETGVGEEIKLVDLKIADEQAFLSDFQTRLDSIDHPSTKAAELSTTARDARLAIQAIGNSKGDRTKIVTERDKHRQTLTSLETDKIKLESRQMIEGAEVGPIRYVANLIYGNATKDQLEKAVRFLIIVLVATFDPLAIALILASNIRFQTPIPMTSKEHIMVHKDSVFKI